MKVWARMFDILEWKCFHPSKPRIVRKRILRASPEILGTRLKCGHKKTQKQWMVIRECSHRLEDFGLTYFSHHCVCWAPGEIIRYPRVCNDLDIMPCDLRHVVVSSMQQARKVCHKVWPGLCKTISQTHMSERDTTPDVVCLTSSLSVCHAVPSVKLPVATFSACILWAKKKTFTWSNQWFRIPHEPVANLHISMCTQMRVHLHVQHIMILSLSLSHALSGKLLQNYVAPSNTRPSFVFFFPFVRAKMCKQPTPVKCATTRKQHARPLRWRKNPIHHVLRKFSISEFGVIYAIGSLRCCSRRVAIAENIVYQMRGWNMLRVWLSNRCRCCRVPSSVEDDIFISSTFAPSHLCRTSFTEREGESKYSDGGMTNGPVLCEWEEACVVFGWRWYVENVCDVVMIYVHPMHKFKYVVCVVRWDYGRVS